MLTVGGIAAVVGTVLFAKVLDGDDTPGLLKAASNLAGLLPFVYGCFSVFFLGFYGFYQNYAEGKPWTAWLFSLLFVFVGFRVVKNFWILSEVPNARRRILAEAASAGEGD